MQLVSASLAASATLARHARSSSSRWLCYLESGRASRNRGNPRSIWLLPLLLQAKQVPLQQAKRVLLLLLL
jgi:hypothetical protein